MAQKNEFGSKLGVIAATVGSAIGLGNVWRFPAEAQANGGAAFLFVYIICVFLLGIPVMLAETSLGRAGKSDSVGNFKNLTPKKHWWIAGTIGLLASFLILSFYMVVAGWTLEYMFNSITGDLYAGYESAKAAAVNNNFFADKMDECIGSAVRPLVWTFVMIVLNVMLLLLGVNKGIEKMSNLLMPLLFVIMIVFCYVSLTLPNAMEGVKYFLAPDFNKINFGVMVNALGQAFFSLSLGMGVLVTYSAYYPNDVKLTRTAVTVSALDFLMAFLMGLVIFPAVKSFGLDTSGNALQGTTLVFVTLPEIFASMKATALWSSLFFLLLSVAAITSTVSIAEVSVAFVRDRFKLSRTKACLVVMLPLSVMSVLCSLSLIGGSSLKVAGQTLFDFFDTYATNILLPLSALLICIYVGWVLPRRFLRDELTNYGQLKSRVVPLISFLIRFVCPVLIVLVLVFYFI